MSEHASETSKTETPTSLQDYDRLLRNLDALDECMGATAGLTAALELGAARAGHMQAAVAMAAWSDEFSRLRRRLGGVKDSVWREAP